MKKVFVVLLVWVLFFLFFFILTPLGLILKLKGNRLRIDGQPRWETNKVRIQEISFAKREH